MAGGGMAGEADPTLVNPRVVFDCMVTRDRDLLDLMNDAEFRERRDFPLALPLGRLGQEPPDL
jgi:hypothetical protein